MAGNFGPDGTRWQGFGSESLGPERAPGEAIFPAVAEEQAGFELHLDSTRTGLAMHRDLFDPDDRLAVPVGPLAKDDALERPAVALDTRA